MAPETLKKIVVAGDVSIDWFEIPVAAQDLVFDDHSSQLNWQLHPGSRMIARPGGAMLLAEMIAEACRANNCKSKIFSHTLSGLNRIPPEKAIHSLINLTQVHRSARGKNESVYYVERVRGFCGNPVKRAKPLPIQGDVTGADLMIFDDAGNGFRDAEEIWAKNIGEDRHRQTLCILKTNRPLWKGKLWNALQETFDDNLVVVIRADDLRASGANISRCLSWERTAQDFIRQMIGSPDLFQTAKCSNLIVLFDLDGVIHVRRTGEETDVILFYDPSGMEGEFRKSQPGEMIGYANAFVSSLTGHLAKGGIAAMNNGIIAGIQSSRQLLKIGFGGDPLSRNRSFEPVFKPPLGEDHISQTVIPEPTSPTFANWSILRSLKDAKLEMLAYQIVKENEADTLKEVPFAKFGNFKTVDRNEIESFRSIKNLLVEYLNNPTVNRPLSIGVFGPPGSGKSFGVTEIAKSLERSEGQETTKLEFNVSQFTSAEDLIKAFHLVRDDVLRGKTPLVFFDEFDSSYQGKLGWLKYFLTPMQDGTFRDGETMHPIGRAIFVFAGGTCDTFDDFCRSDSGDGVKQNEAGSAKHLRSNDGALFRDAKGPDFLSRLRGYVNILGPNPVDENDNFYMIRRAMLVRSLLWRQRRQDGHLFDSNHHALIDEGVLRAFLKTSSYKHGVRSIQAIIEMSMLSGRKIFEQSALPSAQQLELHVDSNDFVRLVDRDVLFGTLREELGKAVHKKYLVDNKKKKRTDEPSMQPWDSLTEEMRESNREQADDIPAKLKVVNCGFEYKVTGHTDFVGFAPEETEILAEIEHERWMAEKFRNGWIYGKVRNDAKKIHPYLVPWWELDETTKDLDRNTVREIPLFLDTHGFQVYRFQ